MKGNTFIVEELHGKHITGLLICRETALTPSETWRDYEVQFSVSKDGINPLMAIRDYEISEMLSMLSQMKESIDRWEGKIAAEEELSYA